MPRERLRELQLERLRSLVAYARERVPLYRERLAEIAVDDISSLDDLRRLPFTRKSDLRDTYPLGMLATPRDDTGSPRSSAQESPASAPRSDRDRT